MAQALRENRQSRSSLGAVREPFEVRVERLHDNEVALEVWQKPLNGRGAREPEARRVARVRGLALHVAWEHLMLVLQRGGVRASQLSPAQRERTVSIPEEVGVRLALLAATVAPLRKLQRIETAADAIGHMSYEEACYWYAHARSDHGRRALRALRLLLAPE